MNAEKWIKKAANLTSLAALGSLMFLAVLGAIGFFRWVI